MSKEFKSVLKKHIASIGAYKPPLEGRDPKSHLLLDFNERTLPVAKVVEEALINYIRDGRLQMYPSYSDICEKIADYCGVRAEQLMITNGSDQGIELIFRAVCSEGDEAIIPAPSFAMYNQCAKIENCKIIEPAFSNKNGFPTQDILSRVTDKTKIICVANPNNPSGTVVSRQDIIKIAEAAPNAAILVDECYYEYFGETVVDLVDDYPNIFVTRTFSKTWGIPSLRLGYIISHPQNILSLLNVRGPYDINQLAVVAVRAALTQKESTLSYVEEVMQKSKPAFEQFLDSNNIEYWPSGANYIWVFPENHQKVEAALRENHILVRPKANPDGKIGLRVTLGTLEQTQRMIQVFEAAF